MDAGNTTKQQYLKQAEHFTSAELLTCIDLANECDFNYKLSQNKLLHVELCLMKLASLKTATPKKKPEVNIAPPSGVTQHKTQPKQVAETQETQKEKEVESPKSSSTQKSEKNTISPNVQIPLPEVKKKTNGLSLKAIQFKKEFTSKHTKKTESGPELKGEFTHEELKSTWMKYAEILDKKGEKILASTMLSDLPELKDNTIVVTMPNESMKVSLNQSKGKILGYIHNALQNNTIELNIKVSKTEVKKYIHTKEEKYKHFVERNPKIKDLKNALDLDI